MQSMATLEIVQRVGPHVVVLGECASADALTVRAEPEVTARVAVGQEVEILYRYAFVGAELERDFFRVSLASRIGNTTPPPKLYQAMGKKGLRDDLRGFLAHRYAFRAPGIYEGAFALHAEVIAQSRTSGEVVHWKTATRQGAIRLHVGEAEFGAGVTAE